MPYAASTKKTQLNAKWVTKVALSNGHNGWEQIEKRTETSLHRTLADLTPILDVRRSRHSVLLGGDLNASTQFPPPYRDAYRIVHERLLSFRLKNVSIPADGEKLDGCPCSDSPCRHIRTLEGKRPYQDD